MNNSWNAEVWRLIALLTVAVILGLIFDLTLLFLCITLAVYLGWTLHNLRHLHRWLARGKKYSPPTSVGLWGLLFTEIYRLQKRNKKRQRRLASLLSRFRETTEAMPNGVVVMQANDTIEWWNEIGGKLLDLSYPQDVGQRITNLVRSPEFVRFYERGDREEIFQCPAPSDSNKIIALQFTPYGNEQSLLTVRDVTILERVEQIRRDFVANISHELRTPLTVMTGYLEAMDNDEEEKDEETRRSLKLMRQQSKRMSHLVEDLMLLSKLENDQKPIKHDIVGVPQILHNLKEEAEILSGERQHDIRFDVDESLDIYGDAKDLDSAFRNIVFNAINYTPDKGRIDVKWYSDEKGVHFEVIDTGIGIPSHHIPRLTERFYRVDVARSRETGGSGLGLAIVKHAMNRHQAELRITSEVGKGSHFICDFSEDLRVTESSSQEAV